MHPVSVVTGGFSGAPTKAQADTLRIDLQEAIEDARALLQWTTAFKLPDDKQDFTVVALHHPDEYPMNEGRLVSSAGLDITIADYQQNFQETHTPHSTALHSHLHDKPYLVGPLARMNLNYTKMPSAVTEVIEASAIRFPSQNVFHSMVARAAEIYFALLEAIDILEKYEPPHQSHVPGTPQAGVGYGCTEAPRGILWHRYELDAGGMVKSAIIVPPTSQNQARIEEDLRVSLQKFGLEQDDETLRLHGETVIRNYDPCISCATHFLKIIVHRT